MVKPWQYCRIIGPLLSQRFLLASAKAQPRGGFIKTGSPIEPGNLVSQVYSTRMPLARNQGYTSMLFQRNLNTLVKQDVQILPGSMGHPTEPWKDSLNDESKMHSCLLTLHTEHIMKPIFWRLRRQLSGTSSFLSPPVRIARWAHMRRQIIIHIL